MFRDNICCEIVLWCFKIFQGEQFLLWKIFLVLLSRFVDRKYLRGEQFLLWKIFLVLLSRICEQKIFL